MLGFKGFILLNSNQLRETVVGKISGDCSLNWNVLLPTRKNRLVLARVAPNNIFCPQLDHKVEPAQTPPESAEKGKGYRERKKASHPWSVSAYCYWVHIEKLSISNTCLHKHRKLRQCWLSCCWKNTFIYLCIAMFQHENHTHMYADHFHNPPVEVTVLLLHFLWPYGQEGCRTYRSSGHSVERFGSKDGSDTVWSTHWI